MSGFLLLSASIPGFSAVQAVAAQCSPIQRVSLNQRLQSVLAMNCHCRRACWNAPVSQKIGQRQSSACRAKYAPRAGEAFANVQ